MPRHTPTRRQRASACHTRPPKAEVPSTIWATGPDQINASDPWPAPIVTRAVTEFSRPADGVVLLASPTTTGRRPRLTSGTRAALTTIEDLERSSTIEHLGDRHGTARTRTPHKAGEADLILSSLLPPENTTLSMIDEIIARAAARLAAGGVLVVFTRTTHNRDGVLLDATGATVAAAQAADLLFLQHIVAVPISDGAIVAPVTDATRHTPLHTVAHTDITVLLHP